MTSNVIGSNTLNKLFTTFAFVFVALVSLILALTPVATAYEYSIYDVYSPLLWVFLGAVFILPFVYLYISNSDRFKIEFQKKTAGLILVASAFVLILSLYIPKSRGYYFYSNGDTLSHLGNVLEIFNTGYVPDNLFYPFSHVLVTGYSMITGLPGTEIAFHLIPLFSLIFVIGFFCLVKAMHFNTNHVVSITAFATIPIFGHFLTKEFIMPSTFGWLLLPIYLYVVYRFITYNDQRIVYFILMIILSVTSWVIHPESIVFQSTLLISVTILYIFINITHKNKTHISYKLFIFPIGLILAGFLYLLSFPSTSSILSNYVNLFLDIISGLFEKILSMIGIGFVSAADVVQTAVTNSILPESGDKSGFISQIIALFTKPQSLFQKLIYGFGLYGQLLLLSMLSAIFILYSFATNKFKKINLKYLLIYDLFIIFVVISIILLITDSNIGWGIFRMYKYPIFLGIIICGLFFADIVLSNNKKLLKRILSVIFTISLVIIIICAFGNYYDSPHTASANDHITYQGISGMQLFYNNMNIDNLIVESNINNHQKCYLEFIYGYSKYFKNIRSGFDNNIIIPDIYGYDIHDYFGDSYSKNTYYLKYPPTGPLSWWLLPDIKYFNKLSPDDYLHLEYDNSVNLIQTGGDLSVYLIVNE